MSAPLRILVVDDERISREATSLQLRAAGYAAEAVESGRAALTKLESGPWDVVLTDLRMPGMDGLALLRAAKRVAPDVEVIVMTAFGTVESAVAAMREGAADYVTKPFRFPELDLRVKRLAQARDLKTELKRLRAILDADGARHGILGRSPAILRACERLDLFADCEAPVLVTGETGTGKELVARAIHDCSPRKHGPLVAIACGAMPRELADSHLFGRDEGRAIGAHHKGCFERASGGTLLMDDIDELAQEAQLMIVRALQARVLRRVGGSEDVPIDVRIVATTKRDLAQAVAEGRFREDLFLRLRGLEVHLPPLRERGDDVLLLAHHFLRSLAPSGQDAPPKRLTPEAADLLRAYRWPGNVRELRRGMESAFALSASAEIEPVHLPQYMEERLFTLHLEHLAQVDLPQLVARIEEDVLKWALGRAQGQQTRAAELVGVPRTTLQGKLERLH